MKRIISLLLILCLLPGLSACGSGNTGGTDAPAQSEPAQSEPAQSEPAQSEPAPPETKPEPMPSETKPEPTQSETPPEPAETAAPYLERVPHACQPIYDGPGYIYDRVGIVEEAGVYTITEEVTDESGTLWGKLKSGAGWIDLDKVRAPIAADYAELMLMDHTGTYIEFIAEESEYLERIAFCANEALKDITFALLEFNEESYGIAEVLYTLPELSPDEPFVAGIVFYGDFTTYGISFSDSEGVVHHYAVCTSGKDGSLVMTEYMP